MRKTQNQTDCLSLVPLHSLVMAPKLSSVLSLIIFLRLFLFPILSHARLSPSPKGEKASTFEFIKDLQQCYNRDKVKGIHKLKKYLQQFGYLSYSHAKNKTHAYDDDFDDLVESTVRTYQTNYHLKVIESLDSETVSKMVKPHCGVVHIVNDTSWMCLGEKRHHYGGHGSLHTVAHYTFFKGFPRWPASKTHLTYACLPSTPSQSKSPMACTFDQ